MADLTLPDLGENISAGDALRVLVKPGDALAKDQPVLDLETDKATIEVPSSVAGTVGEIKVKQGDKVKVGQVILTVTDGQAGQAGRAGQAERSAEASRASGEDVERSAEASRASGGDVERSAEASRASGEDAERSAEASRSSGA